MQKLIQKALAARVPGLRFAGLIISAGFANTASAIEIPSVQLSGFGTIGYSISDSDTAEYRLGFAKDGVDDSGTFLLDTRLGFQLDSAISDTISATVQVLARDDEDGQFTPSLEWAFLKWAASDTWSARIGRMSLPAFKLSDYREVGYASILLRPPEDTYSQVALRRFDGVSANGQFEMGTALLNAEAIAGFTREDVQDNTTVNADLILGANVSVNQGVATLRLSHVYSNTEIDNDSVIESRDSLIALGLAFPTLSPALDPVIDFTSGDAQTISLSSIALDLDFDRLFVNTEFAWLQTENYILSTRSWNVAVGYRFGAWTPYVFASSLEHTDDLLVLTLPDGAELQAVADGVNVFFQSPDQATSGVGARWDFKPNVALKFQLEQITRDDIGFSFTRSTDDGDDDGEDVTLLSFTLDYIF